MGQYPLSFVSWLVSISVPHLYFAFFYTCMNHKCQKINLGAFSHSIKGDRPFEKSSHLLVEPSGKRAFWGTIKVHLSPQISSAEKAPAFITD